MISKKISQIVIIWVKTGKILKDCAGLNPQVTHPQVQKWSTLLPSIIINISEPSQSKPFLFY